MLVKQTKLRCLFVRVACCASDFLKIVKMCATPVKKVPIHLQSSQNRLIIKNGKIVNADGVIDGDIFIEDGVIKELGRNLIIPGGTRAIDARGRYVFPGGIDPHTHFELEFMGAVSVDGFYQGTKAAVAGGTTTVIDFVIPKAGQSLLEAYYERRENADTKVCCDYGLHVAVTNASDKTKQEMTELTGDELGVSSFKFFMAYKDTLMVRDPELYALFEHCRKIGALAMVHAENGDAVAENAKRLLAKGVTGPEGHQLSRPEDVEAEAVTRAAMIANQVNCPLYVVHVMSREAAEAVVLARTRGNVIFAETLAAALSTDGRAYKHTCWEHAAGHVLSPPLRSHPSTPETLMRFLSSNGLQATGSDHCVFSLSQKSIGKENFTLIPNGVNGVEERMAIVWERGVKAGVLDLPQFVDVTSTCAAKLFNLYPRKGVIAVGSDADLVIWDPARAYTISAKTHHSAGDFNVFEGQQMSGAPQYVIVNGRVCVDDYELRAVEGHGKFLPTGPWSPAAYEPIKAREQNSGTAVNGIPDLKPLQITPPVASENGHTLRTVQEVSSPIPPPTPATPSSTGRQMRQEGQRDLQGTTFVVGGEGPEASAHKSSIRVANPPGGRSAGGFW